MAKRRDPFEVHLDDQQQTDLVTDLVNAIEDATEARSTLDDDSAYWMRLYEQQRTRLASNMPWPDAADLTSYLGTEKVDALHARLYRTVVGVEPIWTVEGWGDAAERAPIVEEFHQWKAEEERLQGMLDRVLLLSLIEPMAVLEVSEDTERRRVREEKDVAVEMDPITGGMVMNEDLTPRLLRDPETGDYVEAQPDQPAAKAVLDTSTRVRVGPAYKIVPFRDFYVLPGHARDEDEVWGYAKRFYRRLGELKERAKNRQYDRDVVDKLPEHDERRTESEDERTGITITQRPGDQADKELWEVLFLKNLDGKGERWYLATIHAQTRELLRLQHDDLAKRRFVRFTPLPRPDSIYGYSFIGEKLITVVEGHTAFLNAMVDKIMMALQAPIKRHTSAIWQPSEVPWGPKAVIDVRDMNEVQPVVMPDLPQGAFNMYQEFVAAGERLAGVNDVASGSMPVEGRTLGEVQLVTEQSFVRMDQIVRRVQESLEDLFMIRHEIYKRAAAENPDIGKMPQKSLTGLEHRGIMIEEGQISAATLSGQFRGKPRGSVESADVNRKRARLNALIATLMQAAQVWPAMAQLLQTPQAARAILEEALRVHDFEDRQAFLGPPELQGQGQGLGGLMPGMPPPGLAELLGSAGVGQPVPPTAGPAPLSPQVSGEVGI